MFPRSWSVAPQLILLKAVQRRGHSSRSTPSSPDAPSPESPITKTTASKRRSLLPEKQVVDWTPGIDYYFSAEEEKRFMKACTVSTTVKRKQEITENISNSNRNTSSPDSKNSVGKDGAADDDGKTSKHVILKGLFRSFVIDTSIPPLRKEEVERWRLESYPIMKGLSVRRRSEGSREISLLPPDAMITYLGEDVRRLDQVYRQGGYYTPSEVAEALLPFVPTFPVELPRVVAAIPPSLMRRIDQDIGEKNIGYQLFNRYPMLFNYNYRRFSTAIIQLNSTYWFVRQHPSYGKADSAMRKYRVHEQIGYQDSNTATLPSGSTASPLALRGVDDDKADAASSGKPGTASGQSSEKRMPLTVKVFHMLVRNLPRFPTPPADAADTASKTYAERKTQSYLKNRYAPLNVAQWINSFPPEDVRLLGSLPEQVILSVLSQYVHVFQIMSLTESDPNIFVEGSVLLAARAERKASKALASSATAAAAGTAARGGTEQMLDEDDVLDDEEGFTEDSLESENQREHSVNRGSGEANSTVKKAGNTSSTTPTASTPDLRRSSKEDEAKSSARFQRAIVDDLIDVEDILVGPEGGTVLTEPAAAGLPQNDSGGTSIHNNVGCFGDGNGTNKDGSLAFNEDDDKPFTLSEEEYDGDEMDAEYNRFHSHGKDGGNYDKNNGGQRRNSSDTHSTDSDGDEGSDFAPARGMRTPLPPGASIDNDLTTFGLPLEDIYVRRLPPDVAPRSLSDWDETTSPDVELASLAARFLAPPPSSGLGDKSSNFFVKSAQRHHPFAHPLLLWRWVPVERLYHGYTVEQRHYLRREYKGLVNFLRYHGKLFELSNDLLYVIAHDPEGKLAPIPFMERRFKSEERVVLPRTFDDNETQSAALVGENERALFARIGGEGRVPTSRRHLLLLDPTNPIFLPDVLHEEIANFLPDYPVRITTVVHRLPPVLRAALPYRANFAASKYLTVLTDRGVTMLAKRSVTDKPGCVKGDETPMSVEDAVGELLQAPIGPEGVTLTALRFLHLSAAAVNTLCDHYGTLKRAIRAYPQYFECESQEMKGKKMPIVKFRK